MNHDQCSSNTTTYTGVGAAYLVVEKASGVSCGGAPGGQLVIFHYVAEHPAGNLGGRSNMGQNQVGGCYPVGPRTDGHVGCDREPGPWSCGLAALGPHATGSSWTRHVDGRPGVPLVADADV